jgi:predicted alpha/beta-hydrolase family hydrolase
MQDKNVVYLPGASSGTNRDWALDIQAALADKYHYSYAHRYQHWDDGGHQIDLDLEVETLTEQIADIESYGLIAKSVGAVLALRGMYEGILQPDYLICLGFPLKPLTHSDISLKKWIEHAENIPIIIVQNVDDPLGSYDEVTSWINQLNKRIVFVQLPGETHTYDDFEAIDKIITGLDKSLTEKGST